MEPNYQIEDQEIKVSKTKKIICSHDYEVLLCAEQLISAAKSKADEIVENAEQVYEAQKKAGYEEGIKTAETEIANKLLELSAEYAESVQNIEASMVGLIPSLVKKVIGTFSEDEVVLRVVRNTITTLSSEGSLKILVNPGLVEKIENRVNEILETHPLLKYIEVVQDSDLLERECILESESLVVSVNVDDQLAKLESLISAG